MNLAIIPLLLVALLMMSTGDSEVETVEMVLAGQHLVDEQRGGLIVGDADVTVPVDARLPGPIYVIGGHLVVQGRVDGDVIQLAGSVAVEAGATISGELQHIGGTQAVSDSAEVDRRSSLELIPAERGLAASYVPVGILAVLLALVGARLTRKRARALDNVADALAKHPVVTITVGTLLTLTFIAVFVFMAFTLVLIPVAFLGAFIALVTVAYGFVGWGHLVGTRLSRLSSGRATALGVLIAFVVVELVGLIPLVGDLIVIGVLASGLGAVVVTYFGVARFEPAILSD